MPGEDAFLEVHSRTHPPPPQSKTTSERIRLRGNFQKCKSRADINPCIAVDHCSLRWGKPTASSYCEQQPPQDPTMRSPCKKFFIITKNIIPELQLWSLKAPALSHPHIHKPRGTMGRALNQSAAQIPAEFTLRLSNQRQVHLCVKHINSKDSDQSLLVLFMSFVFLGGQGRGGEAL